MVGIRASGPSCPRFDSLHSPKIQIKKLLVLTSFINGTAAKSRGKHRLKTHLVLASGNLCQGYGIKKLGGKVSNFLPFMPFGAFYSSVIKTNAALSIKVIIINDLKSFANLATSRSNLRQSRF